MLAATDGLLTQALGQQYSQVGPSSAPPVA